MAENLTLLQTSGTLVLGEFEHGLLEALLGRAVPNALPVGQARVLAGEAHAACNALHNPQLKLLALNFLAQLRGVLAEAPE